MESIYSSKLYRASKRKDRINAAMLAPTNLELVTQLAEDLGEEYQTPENLGYETEEMKAKKAEEQEQAEQDEVNFDEFIVDDESEDINPETDLVTMDDLGSTSGDESIETPSKEAKSEESKSEESAEASTEVEATQEIKACTKVDISVLKSTLNSREDTAGVARIAEKETELWIYYKDDVNLNNVMTDVIEFLINSHYTSLEFNRLARTDNAIVFECLDQVVDLTKSEMMEQVEELAK